MEYLAFGQTTDSVVSRLHAGTAESPRTLCGRPTDDFALLDGVEEDFEGDARWCPMCRDALADMGAEDEPGGPASG